MEVSSLEQDSSWCSTLMLYVSAILCILVGSNEQKVDHICSCAEMQCICLSHLKKEVSGESRQPISLCIASLAHRVVDAMQYINPRGMANEAKLQSYTQWMTEL